MMNSNTEISKVGEGKVGIEEYITKTPGIGGKIKSDPSFFEVTEVIDLPEFHEDGSYLIILVEKTNWDTINFARVLSNRLGISQKRVEYAGTKDKRAKTLQFYSIKRVDDRIVQRLNELSIKDAEIKVLGKARRGLKLGDLLGNFFEIRITEIDGEEEEISSTVEELKEKGIPNFFGLQRFGTIRYITHEVGLHLLRREYEEAFWIYVAKPFELENEEVKKIREELWETRDAKFGLREVPNYLRYERNLLQKLQEGLNEEKALLTLPKNLKLMFVHAYQSWIFNRTLSARIKEFGSLREFETTDYVDFISIRKVEHPRTQELFVPLLKNEPVKTSLNERRVAFLISKRRSLLVLPLPGYDTKLDKENWAIRKEMEFLEADGVSIEDFKHEYKEFSSSGSFRAAEIPFDFSNLEFECDKTNKEAYFSFFLPKGCYATVFLREFMKN